jgi:hypothetical protein
VAPLASRLVQFTITRVAVPRRANGPDPEPPPGVHEHESSGDRRRTSICAAPGGVFAVLFVRAIGCLLYVVAGLQPVADFHQGEAQQVKPLPGVRRCSSFVIGGQPDTQDPIQR